MADNIKSYCIFNNGRRLFRIIPHAGNIEFDGEECFGYTSFLKCEIHINAAMDDGMYRETLLHEILHVILESCAMHDDEAIPSNLGNEFLTAMVSNNLWLSRCLNRDLFADLFNNNKTNTNE